MRTQTLNMGVGFEITLSASQWESQGEWLLIRPKTRERSWGCGCSKNNAAYDDTSHCRMQRACQLGRGQSLLNTVLQQIKTLSYIRGFPSGTVVKNLPANVGGERDTGAIPRLGRSLGEGKGNPLQYYCLENTTDSGVWRATVHGVAKSQTRISTHARTMSCRRQWTVQGRINRNNR